MLLAARVQSFIPDGGSIYLDGGTTCYEVAKQLLSSNKKCTVITDSIAIPRELLGKSGVDVILLGGQLSADGNTLDGPLTAEIAARMSVDLCVISCDGFNNERLEVQGLAGAQTKKLMLQTAALSLCVTASYKYSKQRCFHFCGWEEVDMFLTDSDLPEAARKAIGKHGVEIHVVDIPETDQGNS
jgi:DeoR/GlpR family transcriptional regulator of sugar metabolism